MSCVDSMGKLKDSLEGSKPEILLLDYDLPDLDGQSGLVDLKNISPETKFIILSLDLSDESEWEMFLAGAKGCCHKDIGNNQLVSVIEAVQKGELWIRRSLTNRLLDQLAVIALEKNLLKTEVDNLLSHLTRRELEIATLVGNGESNKQIAHQLAITERTVKAHLTEIFRKLKVADRLKLALMVSGTLSPTHQAQIEEINLRVSH